MKKLFFIALIATFSFASSINWLHDVNKAIDIAKKEKKNILIFVNAADCPFCDQMEEEIFEDKEDINYLSKKYIFVNLDIDSAQKIFPNTYVTPTTYIITPDKKLLASQIGYQNEEFFYWTIGKADNALKELQKSNK